MTDPATLAGASTETLLKKILIATEKGGGGGGGEAVWGGITGDIEEQEDLVGLIDEKISEIPPPSGGGADLQEVWMFSGI
jgi:hypothetical protein